MITKRQKARTLILVIIFAVIIIAGVFAISYYLGGVTFPWEVTSAENTDESAAADDSDTAAEQDVNLIVTEPETTTAEDVEEAEPKVEAKEKPKKDTEAKVEEPVETDAAVTGLESNYYGALSVKEGKLVDSKGNKVQLLGVSSHGLSWYPEFITADSIKSMKENWGINVIRLAMYTSDYNGYCVGSDENKQQLKDKIDEAVTAATENEMYVIIDWHILNDGNPNTYKSEAIQFFGEMVRQYEDNENILYEICNEPNGDNVTWADVKSYANELIPVIRNVDEDAIILVGSPAWSSDLESVMAEPLDFDNIMYTYHFYSGTHKAKARNVLLDALDSGLPVFISEFGFTSADGDGAIDEKEAEKWVDIIDEYGLSACIWNLSNKDEASALISADSDKLYDWTYDDLSGQGQFVFDLLSNEETKEDDN